MAALLLSVGRQQQKKALLLLVVFAMVAYNLNLALNKVVSFENGEDNAGTAFDDVEQQGEEAEAEAELASMEPNSNTMPKRNNTIPQSAKEVSATPISISTTRNETRQKTKKLSNSKKQAPTEKETTAANKSPLRIAPWQGKAEMLVVVDAVPADAKAHVTDKQQTTPKSIADRNDHEIESSSRKELATLTITTNDTNEKKSRVFPQTNESSLFQTNATTTTMTFNNNNTSLYIPLTTPNLWDDDNSNNNNNNNSTRFPEWLKEYFTWHQQERLRLFPPTNTSSSSSSSNNRNSTSSSPLSPLWKTEGRYLIMRAPWGKKSGGMTDRIRPLPAYLRLAAQTKRLLLVHWERPYPLEEFMVPPKGGMDWRVPKVMLLERVLLDQQVKLWGTTFSSIETGARSNDPADYIVNSRYQSWNYGEHWYTEQAADGEPGIYEIYRDIWYIVYTPSPPVAQRIQHNFERMGLVPGEFATAHIRALYAINDRALDGIEEMTKNALNCASTLRPGGPFFVASDSSHAIDTAIAYGHELNVTVVAARHPKQPLHLDFQNESDTSITPADLYDGFVDMYLMGSTRCVAVGPGGMARWGNLLGYNASCLAKHYTTKSVPCRWKAALDPGEPMKGYPSEQQRRVIQEQLKSTMPKFPEPML